MDDFLWRALIGGIGLALVTGPIGCFIVWRRMAYFGDTLAHAALLGVSLGFILDISPNIGTIVVCVLLAIVLVLLQQQKRLATDTLLGILSHSALSLGLVVLAFLEELRIDLYSYLFGDLLAISETDIYWIYIGGAAMLLCLGFIWRSLLALTVHEELAQVEGVPVARIRFIFMLMIALIIAIAMKIVGILLITSLLIIPPATARYFSTTPLQMALFSSVLGGISIVGGLGLSYQVDTPAGPSVVVAAMLLFLLVATTPLLKRRS